MKMSSIIDAMERTVIPEGNYACKTGQQANHFYTIESGHLNVCIPTIDKNGDEVMKWVRKIGMKKHTPEDHHTFIA